MSDVFKDNRVTVRHLDDGRTQCVNRTNMRFTVKCLDGAEVVVSAWTEFVGTGKLQTHQPLHALSQGEVEIAPGDQEHL